MDRTLKRKLIALLAAAALVFLGGCEARTERGAAEKLRKRFNGL
jgi:hypothetical protein